MKIGILNFVGDSTVDPATLAKTCEALGFESLFLAEHQVVPTHYTRPDGSKRVPEGKPPEILCQISDLFVSLSFAAAVTSRLVEYDPGVLRPLLESCVAICRSCGDECERHAPRHAHCRVCAEACRRCEQACRALLAALA